VWRFIKIDGFVVPPRKDGTFLILLPFMHNFPPFFLRKKFILSQLSRMVALLKGILKGAFWLGILLLVIFGGLWGKQTIEHIQTTQQQLGDATYQLLQENGELRKALRETCQRENAIRKYLYLDTIPCTGILEEKASVDSSENDKIPFATDLITLLETALITPEKLDLLLPEEALPANPEEEKLFLEAIKKPEIQEYFKNLSVAFVLDPQIPGVVQVKKGGEKFADIYWDAQKKRAMINLTISQKILPLGGFTRSLEGVLANDKTGEVKRAEMLKQLSHIHSDDESGENFLLLGHNEGNVDTIILAVINHERKKITLVSVPRDLWVDDRKINAFYSQFGKDLFVKRMEDLLGRKISGTAIINMDVFPAMIDTLGGIEYTFSKPLIDETYRTVNGGEEGTLFFSAGRHTLSGIEALRVARTRHTSSDFVRADRQQNILVAVRDKLAKTGSAEKIKQVVPVLFRYVTTDLNPLSTVFLFLRVKDYEVRTGNVMSSTNILNAEMHELSSGQKTYVLLPVGGDWKLLQQFVTEAVQK